MGWILPKAQVLIVAGFSLHQNVMHFAPIGSTSNKPSRWFKEKAFRLRKLYDHSPLEGTMILAMLMG